MPVRAHAAGAGATAHFQRPLRGGHCAAHARLLPALSQVAGASRRCVGTGRDQRLLAGGAGNDGVARHQDAGECERRLLEHYADKIVGVLGCYDRLVLSGTLPAMAYPGAMVAVLQREHIRCFDLGQYLEPLREQVRQNAEPIAAEHGLKIQYLRDRHVRKEALVAEVMAQRGPVPGLVHIISAMEACTKYSPWHDKTTGKTGVRFAFGKGLHYFFISSIRSWGWPTSGCRPGRLSGCRCGLTAITGLPTGSSRRTCAFGWTISLSSRSVIGSERRCSVTNSPSSACTKSWWLLLGAIVRRAPGFPKVIDWSVMQAECVLAIVLKRAEDMRPICEEISRQAVLAVKIDEMARFWD